MASKKIFLITLGEELLIGLTANTHLTYVGEQLRRRGVTLSANFTISDSEADIADHFRYCWDKADIVITSGGLGPTIDDRTKEVIAQCVGETLVFDESILRSIEERFRHLGLHMTANNRKQAYRLRSSEVIPNPHGTAPGLWLEKDGQTLVMLPGPPSELKPMFENHVLPRLEQNEAILTAENFIQLRTIGIGESALETKLQPLFDGIQNLNIAYCAHPGQVDCRISFLDDAHTEEDLLELAHRCRAELGQDFLCYGQDNVAKVVSDIVASRKRKLAVAESCTGGLLCSKLAEIPGASAFLVGGVIAYTEASKIDQLDVPEEMIQQHGAVSSEVALAMAAGAAERFEADYTISVTGYAGPDGGDAANPVGTVYLGLHTPYGNWSRRHNFRGARQAIRERAANAALDWLRRELLIEPPADPDAPLRAEAKGFLESLG